MYYREASGAIIVYDVTDLDSFDKVKTWTMELRKYLELDTPIVIAGNKCDIPQRTVELATAEQYARENELEHVSTSAKTGQNVEETFALLAQKVVEKNAMQQKSQPAGKKKRSQRGVMRVEGLQNFNPDMDGGVKLTRESHY